MPSSPLVAHPTNETHSLAGAFLQDCTEWEVYVLIITLPYELSNILDLCSTNSDTEASCLAPSLTLHFGIVARDESVGQLFQVPPKLPQSKNNYGFAGTSFQNDNTLARTPSWPLLDPVYLNSDSINFQITF